MIQAEPSYADCFFLDPLVESKDPKLKKVGVDMGALLMMKVPSLEVTDVAAKDYSQEKIF